MPIPVALKPAFGIVHQLRVEEVRKLRIASLNLFPRRPRVIGEIEPPAILDHPVDDPAKIGLGLPDAFRRVHDMQIADDADASPSSPREKTLLVGLDEPDGSIGHVDSMANEVLTHLGQKRHQRVRADVNLRDHLGPLIGGNLSFIAFEHVRKLVGIGPVNLTRSTEIKLLVLRESLSLVGSRESIEIGPVGRRHLAGLFGNGSVVGNRPVAREDSGVELLAAMQVDRVLTVAEDETILDRRIDPRHEIPDRDDLHHPLHLGPRHQSNRDPGHHAEESVPADREGEELTILGSTAHLQASIGVDDPEGLDIRNERRESKPPTVNIGRERTRDGDLIDSGLLLPHGPDRFIPVLIGVEVTDQFRPHDSTLDFDQTVPTIEFNDAIHPTKIEMHGSAPELLTPHRMPASGHGDRIAGLGRSQDRLTDLLLRTRRENGLHMGGIQTGLSIIDFRHEKRLLR